MSGPDGLYPAPGEACYICGYTREAGRNPETIWCSEGAHHGLPETPLSSTEKGQLIDVLRRIMDEELFKAFEDQP